MNTSTLDTGTVHDLTTRPLILEDFIGQDHIKAQLKAATRSALLRKTVLEHVLILGPKGLGKTTLAKIIATECMIRMDSMLGGELSSEEIRSILASVSGEFPSILFIDEVHRLPKRTQELLYKAMEDYVLEYRLNLSEFVMPITTPIGPFTLIGATTDEASLTPSFVERFGLVLRLELYSDSELMLIIENYAKEIGLSLATGVSARLASKSRGTPRIARNLLRRVRDFSTSTRIVDEAVTKAEDALGIDCAGLNRTDRQYLLIVKDRGGVCSQTTIASVLQERPATLTSSIEPFLLRSGFIVVNPRGRTLTSKGFTHIREHIQNGGS